MSNKSPIIGIDLGTTYCCIGYLNSNQIVEIIENREGHKTTPSYVAFTNDEEIIGRTAKERVILVTEDVVYDTKRLIGQKCDTKYLQLIKKYNWPFKITSDSDDTPLIEITRNGKTKKYKPQEISSILLKYMKTIAEERLDTEVKDAVITVPAYFNYHQRIVTKEAGELAGLNVLKIINEPTAAALAYVHKNNKDWETINVVVFDLGGGTFDVSIVSVQGQSVTVKATAGNTALGGRDFDNNLSEFIVDKIKKLYKKDIRTDDVAMRRIRAQSEMLKINLSSDKETRLDLLVLVDRADVDFVITRSEFEQINTQLYQICIDIVDDCLRNAKMNKSEIDKVVLVGGSTRIPKIQEMLTDFFGGKQLTKAINPDEAVAYGAAVQAAMFTKGDNTRVHYEVNDVTPLSLGIGKRGGVMDIIIPRNSKIPISKTINLVTVTNNQRRAKIGIYEGERSLVQYNTRIGTTVLQLPPKPPGYSLEITFHINTNGILEVSAKTVDGSYTNLVIKYENPNIHSTNNILKDAEINKAKDDKIAKVVKKWRKLENYCSKTEALCDCDRTGMTSDEKVIIRNDCGAVRSWLYENKIKDGSREEEEKLVFKSKEIENICEPVLNYYGYYVKDMHLHKFHELITK